MNNSPITGKNRILTIDIIRGFALFGIFLVNMPAFHSPVFMSSFYGQEVEYTGVDYWIDVFFSLFVEMKFFTIFSFLFGLGFFIFMSRAEEKGHGVKALYLRRILALFLFGAVHVVALWFGDILHTYAVAGVFLLFFYKRKIKTMLIWAVSLLVVLNLLFLLNVLIPSEILLEMEAANAQGFARDLAEYMGIYTQAGYVEWVSYRLGTEVGFVAANLIPASIPVFAMFLFGLAAGKAGLFHHVSNHLAFFKKFRWITFLISLPLVVILALLKLDILDLGVKQLYAIQLFKSLTGTSLCFLYISTLTLMLRKETWQKRLRPLGSAGQMALTNYLMQTIVSTIIFVGFGFYGETSLLTGTILCFIIFALQMGFSTFWLEYYRFGPFEWLWRSFTYLKFQPLKKANKVTIHQNHHTPM
ncbi:DUF418 domain-containing protein [Mesobacillus maritimus]|uniref:DUF418 domain-containing protein n=1 Tax=Mesobacillus maritimus TaxID=1643336 RepID=A0ABS7K0F1_9BACI|nr:DUF418 domain-containing protein [Mesobacillus maritimus]MBY0095728.1 DUF418 domain-containing protein [Mesobacillus maritimus]